MCGCVLCVASLCGSFVVCICVCSWCVFGCLCGVCVVFVECVCGCVCVLCDVCGVSFGVGCVCGVWCGVCICRLCVCGVCCVLWLKVSIHVLLTVSSILSMYLPMSSWLVSLSASLPSVSGLFRPF